MIMNIGRYLVTGTVLSIESMIYDHIRTLLPYLDVYGYLVTGTVNEHTPGNTLRKDLNELPPETASKRASKQR